MLGSKNVKAILAGGKAQPPVADRAALRAISREALQAIHQDAFLNEIQGPIGTPNLVAPVNDFQAFPTGNHQERFFPNAAKVHGELIAQKYAYERTTCPGCPIRCRLHVRVDGQEWDAPEYESLWAFSADNRCDDYGLVCRAVTLCNELGLDTISTGNTVAFYREYTGTLDDPSNILDIVRMMAYREGDGAILAQGSRAAAAHFGVDYAMQVKGLEMAAYDPRKLTGMALSYATTNRGGCHSRAWTVGDELSGRDIPPDELADMVFRYSNAGCVRDSLIECTFLNGVACAFFTRALSAVLGETITEEELTQTGERIHTQERMLNVLRGVGAAQDTLPRRILEGLVAPDKYRAGLAEYYRLRDWDSSGRPSDRRLEQLGLGFLVGK
jgi:aldehyde:ferredoxin oxidoreductase